jgi:hypothetical protein
VPVVLGAILAGNAKNPTSLNQSHPAARNKKQVRCAVRMSGIYTNGNYVAARIDTDTESTPCELETGTCSSVPMDSSGIKQAVAIPMQPRKLHSFFRESFSLLWSHKS